MEEIKISNDDTIFTASLKLIEANKTGKHVYCNFHGVKFYSDSYGCSKAMLEEKNKQIEEEKKLKKLKEERNLAIKRAVVMENVSNLIEKSKPLIYPFRHEEWAKLVEADAFGDYSGMITETAIEIVSAIEEEKPVEDLVEIFKKKADTGWSASLVRNVVMTYSKNGYPFYKAITDGEFTEEECEAILKIMQDNEENSEDLRYASSLAESKKGQL